MIIEKSKFKYGVKDFEKDFGPMTFSRLLMSYRLSQGITQVALAKKLNLSKSNVCDFEKGRKIPSPFKAEQIAKKLKELPAYWVEVALQDMLREESLKYIVKVQNYPKVA